MDRSRDLTGYLASEEREDDPTTDLPFDRDRVRRAVRGIGGRHPHVRHVVLGVASLDGSWSWVEAQGERDGSGSPALADMLYPLGSVTKLYTASIVMLLCERGVIGLEDPLTDHLPEEAVVGLHTRGGKDHSREITVRNLLAHTSGLPDYFEEAPRGHRSLKARVIEREDPEWSLVETLRIVRSLEAHFPPQKQGEWKLKARYSDTNYQLLGALTERATGEPFHRLLQSLIVEPLGLQATFVLGHGPVAGKTRPASIWFGSRELRLDRSMRGWGPDGGLISTADESLKFLRALFAGDLFENETTLALMTERWSRIFFPLSYGLGIMRFRYRSPASGFRRFTLLGHSGSNGSWLFFSPEVGVLFSGTVGQGKVRSLPFRIIRKLVSALPKGVGATSRGQEHLEIS